MKYTSNVTVSFEIDAEDAGDAYEKSYTIMTTANYYIEALDNNDGSALCKDLYIELIQTKAHKSGD